MRPNYEFCPMNDTFPVIQLDDIIEFIISNKFYELNNFKSLKDAYDFLTEHKKDLTYIKYKYTWIDGNYYNSTYLKNGNYHRLSGPAMTEYEKNEKKEYFFIDGLYIDKEDYKKHPEVRAQKLKRIVKE